MAKKLLIMANMMIVFAFIGVLTAFAQTTDTTSPVITGVGATGIAQTTATINWTTDEAADGQAEYGTSTVYGLSSSLVTATTTAHSISLTGLTASTTYHYLVKSKDVAGNLATSTDYTLTTLAPAADTTAPAISAITVSGITDISAIINWTTNEAADSQVEYGTSTAYGLLSPLITATTTAHHIALSSLTASSTYHFIVRSKDAAGNLATSTDYTFATLAAPVASSSLIVKLKVEPRVLNTGSRGNWIEAEVTFPRGTDIRTLDTASIKLNGAILPVKVKTTKQKWYESFTRKTPKAEMKFSRAEVIDLLLSGTVATSTTATASSTSPVIERQQRDLVVSGTIGGKTFSGTASVYLVIRKGGIPPVIFSHKEEKRENKEAMKEKEKEEREHRFDRVITATSTATTTSQGATTTTQITTTIQEVEKHKKEDTSIFRNPFQFITAPFAPIKKQQKEIKKENEKKEKKKDRD